MLKVEPVTDYPVEEGTFLRGNDFSPVAVAVVLIYDQDKVPRDIETLVRVGVESGAALSGTIQTENIGIEKMVCNIIGNPNIRYLIVTGPESPGHSTGEAIIALVKNGVDGRKKIMGTGAPTPYLFNLPLGHIGRFREQIVEVIDLLNRGTPDLVRKAVWTCYQEAPATFEGQMLHDIGAYPEKPISAVLTWKVTNPVFEPKDEAEREQKEGFLKRMEEIRKKVEGRRSGGADSAGSQTRKDT
ncbi:MAG TPA: tetrahydromethanopterin S-methyltransferase subunit A [Dissulfurispiraceae bacterium]|nr:tetrahydromethanopterin S-methyltransferase subunit A [Dissulfurispiraceae bacterium]